MDKFAQAYKAFQQALTELSKDPHAMTDSVRKELEVLRVSIDKIIVSGSGQGQTGGGTQPK